MSETTHTSGQWLQSSSFLVCDSEARIIADCTPMMDVPVLRVPPREAERNAFFISTAPDLLRALKHSAALLGAVSADLQEQCARGDLMPDDTAEVITQLLKARDEAQALIDRIEK